MAEYETVEIWKRDLVGNVGPLIGRIIILPEGQYSEALAIQAIRELFVRETEGIGYAPEQIGFTQTPGLRDADWGSNTSQPAWRI